MVWYSNGWDPTTYDYVVCMITILNPDFFVWYSDAIWILDYFLPLEYQTCQGLR